MLDKSKGLIEKFYPLSAATFSLCFCVLFRVEIAEFFRLHSLSLTQLYSAVFGWASVQTGSLLGVYGIVYSKNDGFIGKIKKSQVMDGFYSFTKTSTYLGLILTVASIPIMVGNHEIKDLVSGWYIVVSLWFALFVYALLSFARVALLFTTMVSVKDREQHIAG